MASRRWLLVGIAVGLLLLSVILAPVAVIWLPGSWCDHVYRELSFHVIARNTLPDAKSPEEIVAAATTYLNRHLWLFRSSRPYEGKSFEYLIEGVGWCDYYAKVFCKLLAAKGVHARYVFLKDRTGTSPHTIAEVYAAGAWRAVDPFFNFRYVTETGEWLELDHTTPERLVSFPAVRLLSAINRPIYENIYTIAQKTLPPPMPPQRSDDFVQDQNVFDAVTKAYFRCFGLRFAYWYQDRVLERRMAAIRDPLERLWFAARNYHLYRRLAEAEPRYRELLARDPAGRYRDRTTLFLSRLLIGQERFDEGRALLEAFVQVSPELPWAHFELGQCYEALDRREQALAQYREYQRLHGRKFSVDVIRRLIHLGAII